MKKVPILLSLICQVLGAQMSAQSFHGKVVDKEGEPLSYVTVSKEGKAACMTDETGCFSISATGIDSLSFTSLGYQTVKVLAIDGMVVTMLPAEYALKDVVVTSSRIKRRSDGYAVNLRNSDLSDGKSTVEMLSVLPGINFSDGRLELLGQPFYAIYVDHVKTDVNELKNISSDKIEDITVKYMADSRESANAKGGILYVKLKKDKNGAYSGNLTGNSTVTPEQGFGGSGLRQTVSARQGKLFLRNRVNINNNKFNGNDHLTQIFKTTGDTIESATHYKNWDRWFSDRLSMNYDLAKGHEISTSLYYSYDTQNPKTDVVPATGSIRNPNHTSTFHVVGKYLWETGKEGNQLSLTADYLSRRNFDKNLIDGELEECARRNTSMLRLRGVYDMNLTKTSKLSLGPDMQVIWYKNIAIKETEDVYDATSSFPSMFVEFESQYKSLQYKIGVRTQENIVTLNREGERSKDTRLGLYPTASVMYMLNPEKERVLSIQYKRYTETMPYSAMSLHRKYTTARHYEIGNPYLKVPVGYQLMAVYSSKKMTFSVMYDYQKDPVIFTTHTTDNGESYTRNENGRYESLLLVHLDYHVKPFSWWTMKTTAQCSFFSDDIYTHQATLLPCPRFTSNNTLKFSKDFGGSMRLYYEPRQKYQNMRLSAAGSVDGGVYMYLNHRHILIKLDAVFYQANRMLRTITDELDMSIQDHANQSRLNLSVSYYFRGKHNLKSSKVVETIQDYQVIENMK